MSYDFLFNYISIPAEQFSDAGTTMGVERDDCAERKQDSIFDIGLEKRAVIIERYGCEWCWMGDSVIRKDARPIFTTDLQ